MIGQGETLWNYIVSFVGMLSNVDKSMVSYMGIEDEEKGLNQFG
jgi:hypothetical protein